MEKLETLEYTKGVFMGGFPGIREIPSEILTCGFAEGTLTVHQSYKQVHRKNWNFQLE